MKITIKAQFYCDLFELDPITRKDIGFLVNITYRVNRRIKKDQIETIEGQTIEDQIETLCQKAKITKKEISSLIVTGCEEKQKKQ